MAKKVENKKTKKLEDTTRIRVDDNRINDADSLDVSFIEGKKKKKANKEKILKEKKDYSYIFDILKIVLTVVVIVVLLVFGYIYALKNDVFKKGIFETKQVEKTKKPEKVKNVKMDYNYLFIGDFHTDGMEFDEFYKPFVKVSNSDYTTKDILDDERDYIYVYNPTDVFIQIGYNDFKGETSIKEVVDNIESIIKGIKINREYANIYVESIYPINDSIEGFNKDENLNNDFIMDINNELESMCKRNNVQYIDMYKELSKDDLLDSNYTDDGINLNSDGYKKVFKVIGRYLD